MIEYKDFKEILIQFLHSYPDDIFTGTQAEYNDMAEEAFLEAYEELCDVLEGE